MFACDELCKENNFVAGAMLCKMGYRTLGRIIIMVHCNNTSNVNTNTKNMTSNYIMTSKVPHDEKNA